MSRSGELRLLRIAEMFRRGERASVRDLAGLFEVSERTIKRDIEALRDQLGLEVDYDPRSRTYGVDREKEERPPLSAAEFASISLATELLGTLGALRGTLIERTLRQALEKLAVTLPPSITLDVEAERRARSFGFSPPRGTWEVLATNLAILHQAVRSRTTVAMRYFTASRGAWVDRRIDPFQLHFRGDSWYAIGYCHLREDVRTFAVQRMDDVRRTNAHFSVPKDFDVSRYLQHAWSVETGEPDDLVVRFARRTATYVRERPWHSTQTLVDLPDGGVELRAHVHCGGEVKRWILQHGADAEVLAPAHLREEIAREVREMGRVYGG